MKMAGWNEIASFVWFAVCREFRPPALARCFTLATVVALMMWPLRLCADQPSVDMPLSDSVWYDADSDSIVPVPVKPVVDDSVNRDSRWLPKPERVKKPKKNSVAPAGGTAGGGSGGVFGSGLTLSNLFGWFVLIVLLAGTIGLLLYAMSKAEVDLSTNPNKRPQNSDDGPDSQTIERMKHLPAELRRTDVNLRSEAERLMIAEQFDQAIILLFAHQLLLLDRVGILRLNRGKTNREYLRETHLRDVKAAERLQGTVDAFERSYFGRHAITVNEFAELWRGNIELEQNVQGRGAAA